MTTQFCAEPKRVTSMSDVARARGPAVRRSERRLRAFWRHEQFSIQMATVTMSHHSSQRKAVLFVDVATRTLVETLAAAATYAATDTPTPVILNEALPVIEYVAPTPAFSSAAPAPVTGYVTPAPADSYTEPSPVIEYVTLAPVDVHAAPARVIECGARTCGRNELIVFSVSTASLISWQPTLRMSALASLVLVNQKRSVAAVEVVAPQVDGLHPLLDSRIQKQSVEDVKVFPQVRQVRFEEQSVDLLDPPIVEEFVDVVQQQTVLNYRSTRTMLSSPLTMTNMVSFYASVKVLAPMILKFESCGTTNSTTDGNLEHGCPVVISHRCPPAMSLTWWRISFWTTVLFPVLMIAPS